LAAGVTVASHYYAEGEVGIVAVLALHEVASSLDYHHTFAQGLTDPRITYVSIVHFEVEAGELPPNWIIG
jgi:hypothetical protein